MQRKQAPQTKGLKAGVAEQASNSKGLKASHEQPGHCLRKAKAWNDSSRTVMLKDYRKSREEKKKKKTS